jgi:hypothetical protein
MKQGRVAPAFGPGGNSESFHATKMKTEQAPIWLAEMGLDAERLFGKKEGKES